MQNGETSPKPYVYEVVVGNVGTVYTGGCVEANKTYAAYVEQSKNGSGSAYGESVFLLRDGDIRKEHEGHLTSGL